MFIFFIYIYMIRAWKKMSVNNLLRLEISRFDGRRFQIHFLLRKALSALVQVMAWCCQATIHYLYQWWSQSKMYLIFVIMNFFIVMLLLFWQLIWSASIWIWLMIIPGCIIFIFLDELMQICLIWNTAWHAYLSSHKLLIIHPLRKYISCKKLNWFFLKFYLLWLL